MKPLSLRALPSTTQFRPGTVVDCSNTFLRSFAGVHRKQPAFSSGRGRVSVSRSLVRPILNAGNLWCSKAAPSNLKSCSFRFDNERIPVQSCTRCGIQWENPKNWLLPIIGGCHVDII
jgi:hypothetical protein